MSFHAQKFSELVFLALFAEETLTQEPDELARLLALELRVAKSHARLAVQKAQEILEKRASYDSEVQNVLIAWDLNRLQRPERIVFWLALHDLDTSNLKDVLAESKRLAKKFSMPKAVQFVHAVLNAIAIKRGVIAETIDLNASVEEYVKKEEEKIPSEN